MAVRTHFTNETAADYAVRLDRAGYWDTCWGVSERHTLIAVWYADYSGGPLYILLSNEDADRALHTAPKCETCGITLYDEGGCPACA